MERSLVVAALLVIRSSEAYTKIDYKGSGRGREDLNFSNATSAFRVWLPIFSR
jgi:hypothetical protein